MKDLKIDKAFLGKLLLMLFAIFACGGMAMALDLGESGSDTDPSGR